jgi:uncharacterized protein YoxC
MTNPEEVAVQRITMGGSEMAVFEFQGQLRELMLADLRSGYLSTGNYTSDGKAISPQGMRSLAVAGIGGGATAVSAALSSTLFMATANPATLMQIGSGVGSAVMGATGIVSQAPFIAVASSLPVVGPLMAMQVVTAVIMLEQFRKLDQKLDDIKNTLDKAIARAEATHAAELAAASYIVDEVYAQYSEAGSFSQDMLIRLAFAEHDVRRLTERFRYFVETHAVTDVDDIADVRRSNFDAHSAMLASCLDLRVSYLRVCVDLQENPKSVAGSVDRLKDKIEGGIEFWQELLKRSATLRDAIQEREVKLNDMPWVERHLPEFIGGKGAAADKKLTALRAAYVSTLESELAIVKGFDSLIESSRQTLTNLKSPQKSVEKTPTMVYWQDEDGEHSFFTEKVLLNS